MLADRPAIDQRSQRAAKVADVVTPVMVDDREMVARQSQRNLVLKLEVQCPWRRLFSRQSRPPDQERNRVNTQRIRQLPAQTPGIGRQHDVLHHKGFAKTIPACWQLQPLLIFDEAIFQIVESMAKSFNQGSRVFGGAADTIEEFGRADELDFAVRDGTRCRAAPSSFFNNAHLAEDLAAMDSSKNDFHTVPPTQNFDASATDVQNAFNGVTFTEKNVASSETSGARHCVPQS